MNRFCRLKIGCNNCGHEFYIKIKEGKDFGEQNYKLYHRPPLTCPKCGFQENSDFDHHSNRYFFGNFENLGWVVEAEKDAKAVQNKSATDSKESGKVD